MSEETYWPIAITPWLIAIALWVPSEWLDKFIATKVGARIDQAWAIVAWPMRELTYRLRAPIFTGRRRRTGGRDRRRSSAG